MKTPDGRAGRLGLRDDGVDILRRADIVGKRDATPAAGVLDGAVLGERLAAPERDDQGAGLEEDDVVIGARARLPPERLVERPCPREVTHAERDDTQSLVHQLSTRSICAPSPRRRSSIRS